MFDRPIRSSEYFTRVFPTKGRNARNSPFPMPTVKSRITAKVAVYGRQPVPPGTINSNVSYRVTKVHVTKRIIISMSIDLYQNSLSDIGRVVCQNTFVNQIQTPWFKAVQKQLTSFVTLLLVSFVSDSKHGDISRIICGSLKFSCFLLILLVMTIESAAFWLILH